MEKLIITSGLYVFILAAGLLSGCNSQAGEQKKLAKDLELNQRNLVELQADLEEAKTKLEKIQQAQPEEIGVGQERIDSRLVLIN